jgi:hypothetical protein
MVPFDAAYIIKPDGTQRQEFRINLPTTDSEFSYSFDVVLITPTPEATIEAVPNP